MTATDITPDASPSTTLSSTAFADRMIELLNSGTLALMVSIGHRTGLFDALAELDGSSHADGHTSAEIAAEADLDERYVREWLGAMTTGRIVEYTPSTQRFRLPAAHAEWMTRSAPEGNLAALAQYVGVLGSVEDRVVRCFREGGGVPYSAFDRFQEVMAEDSGQSVLPALVDAILPLAPGLVERLEAGIDVLDVGCGSGRAMNLLARRFPNSRFSGYDLSLDGIATARAEAPTSGKHRPTFEIRDVAELREKARYDLITAFDVVHDQARPAAVLRNVRRALRPDGVFLMQDIKASAHLEKNMDLPTAPLLYSISTMHCMTVSLAEGGAGLGTCWGVETAERMLAEAGFGSVEVHDLPHDIQNCFYVARLG